MQESALRTDDKRLRIENAAIELFLRQGIGGTSVGQIAQKAGVAKGSVYTYFKDKQAIIDQAVLDKTFEVFEYTLQQAPPAQGEDWPVTFCGALIDFYTQNPHILRFIMASKERGVLASYVESGQLSVPQGHFLRRLVGHFCCGEPPRDDFNRMAMALEFVVSSSYYAVVRRQPDDIRVVRPLILHTVSKLCSSR